MEELCTLVGLFAFCVWFGEFCLWLLVLLVYFVVFDLMGICWLLVVIDGVHFTLVWLGGFGCVLLFVLRGFG